ncbi:MAG TPA: hypothetical protein VN442_20645 [Bryobacteraceae bacterium]|nr:hypothetical protein [Bryobacteraceae bacterium]
MENHVVCDLQAAVALPVDQDVGISERHEAILIEVREVLMQFIGGIAVDRDAEESVRLEQ